MLSERIREPKPYENKGLVIRKSSGWNAGQTLRDSPPVQIRTAGQDV